MGILFRTSYHKAMNDLKLNKPVGIVVYIPIDDPFVVNGELIMSEIFILAMSGGNDSLSDEIFGNIFYFIFRCSGL